MDRDVLHNLFVIVSSILSGFLIIDRLYSGMNLYSQVLMPGYLKILYLIIAIVVSYFIIKYVASIFDKKKHIASLIILVILILLVFLLPAPPREEFALLGTNFGANILPTIKSNPPTEQEVVIHEPGVFDVAPDEVEAIKQRNRESKSQEELARLSTEELREYCLDECNKYCGSIDKFCSKSIFSTGECEHICS